MTDVDTLKEGLDELIVLAQEAETADDKLSFLSQVFDEVHTDNNLLPFVWSKLLEFHSDKFPEVRSWLIEVIQKVLSNDPSHFYDSIKTVASLCKDEDFDVLKICISNCISIYSRGLSFILAEANGNNTSEITQLWKDLTQVKSAIMSKLRDPSKNQRLFPYIYKFIESLIFLFTENESSNVRFNFAKSMIDKFNNFPLVTSSIIKDEAETYINLMLNSIKQNLLPSSITSLVNTLGNVGRLRPSMLSKIVPAFMTFQKTAHSSVDHTQVASVLYAIRYNLVVFLRIRTPHMSQYQEAVVDLVTSMGGKDQIPSYIGKLSTEAVTKRYATDQLGPELKKIKEEPGTTRPLPPPTPTPTTTGTVTPPPSQELPISLNNIKQQAQTTQIPSLQGLSGVSGILAGINPTQLGAGILELLLGANFTIEMIADVVMESMVNFPPNPPPPTASSLTPPIPSTTPTTPPPITNQPSIPPPSVGRRDPRLPKQEGSSSTGIEQVGSGWGSAEMMTTLPPQLVQPTGPFFPQFQQEEPSGPAFNTNTPPPPSSLPMIPDVYIKNEDRNRPKVDFNSVMVNGVFTPKITPLDEMESKDFSNMAFYRILTVEKQAESGGKALLRRALLCRLATSIDLQDNLLENLLDHILQNMNARKELALSWITQELLNEINIQDENNFNLEPESRYSQILSKLIESMDERLDSKDRSLSYLILETPVLTDDVFNLLSIYCTHPDKLTMGFSILRDITLYRPTYTDKALNILLNFTSYSDDNVRSTAIKLITNRLYIPDSKEDNISLLIEDYATKLLTSLYVLSADEPTDSVASETEQFTEDEIKRRLLLFLSLCTKKHDLLQGVVEVYIRGTPLVKKLVFSQTGGLIRSIGMGSPALMSLLTNMPKKGDAIVLHFLIALTENSKPTQFLISTIKSMYYKQQVDSRFLIPILTALDKSEILENLPKLITLHSSQLKTALLRLNNAPNLSPSELLISLHLIDTNEKTQLKKVIEAIQICFEQKSVFTHSVLAIVLQQLIDMSPLPPLVMRTIIQSISLYPKLIAFTMTLLSRLINKQIWNDKRLWEGFIKCCKITEPHSVPILLQIPAQQLESAIQIEPDIKNLLIDYCKDNATPLPSAVKSILGIQ